METSVIATGQSSEQQDLDPEIDALLRKQGAVSEHEYLQLTDYSKRLVEFVDGQIEVLSMPTTQHQAISRYLLHAFEAVVTPLGGEVFYAPLRVQIQRRVYREPDLLVMRAADDPRIGERYWMGADLVVEIVSPSPKDAARDYDAKPGDYAAVGITEYWIVDPQRETITILQLAGASYVEHGVFGHGAVARSPLFPDLAVDVDAVFATGRPRRT